MRSPGSQDPAEVGRGPVGSIAGAGGDGCRAAGADVPGSGTGIAAGVVGVGGLSVAPVRPRESGDWRTMMHAYHPHGEPQVPGKCLKYWLMSAHHGALGGSVLSCRELA